MPCSLRGKNDEWLKNFVHTFKLCMENNEGIEISNTLDNRIMGSAVGSTSIRESGKPHMDSFETRIYIWFYHGDYDFHEESTCRLFSLVIPFFIGQSSELSAGYTTGMTPVTKNERIRARTRPMKYWTRSPGS